MADVLNHLALPWFVLVVAYMGSYSLIMRNSLIDVMNDDFVMTARAKGVREKQILWRHVVPNALLPTFRSCCSRWGSSSAARSRSSTCSRIPDWACSGAGDRLEGLPPLQGLFLLFSAAVIIANLIADILYSQLDPRVRAA